MVLGKLDVQNNETRPPSYTTKDLNIRPETIKIIEENTGSKILGIAHRNILSDKSPHSRETKQNINRWDYMKLKSFCKGNQQNKKTSHRMEEWICQYI